MSNCCHCFKPTEKIEIPEILRKMNRIFAENGFEAYLVGGAVRDMLMGKSAIEASDWDITTNAKPEDVMRIFTKVIPTGIEHGTVTVRFMKTSIEVTTFRTESDYSDGRHPDKVDFCATLEEDLSRRDFTINAIAASLEDGKIIDPFGGRKDIHFKIIRTVGNPLERFSEDGLRTVRAVRFASKLGFEIDEATFFAIPCCLEKTACVSIERFRDEFCKMLLTQKPSVALRLMEHTGILQLFLGEFLEARGCAQSDFRGFHEFDVLDHLFLACDGAAIYAKGNLIVALAAFFHDIGKVKAKKIEQTPDGNTKISFHQHEIYSEELCRSIMTRMKFSNDQINSTCHLVKEHMFHYETSWSDAAVRRFIIRAGKDNVQENLENLFALRMCDLYGMHGKRSEECPENSKEGENFVALEDLKARIKKELYETSVTPALSLKSLAVDGNDLMKLGIPKGKEIGRILNALMELVIENPTMNTRETLLEKAREV